MVGAAGELPLVGTYTRKLNKKQEWPMKNGDFYKTVKTGK
jgi:hypothetical protein